MATCAANVSVVDLHKDRIAAARRDLDRIVEALQHRGIPTTRASESRFDFDRVLDRPGVAVDHYLTTCPICDEPALVYIDVHDAAPLFGCLMEEIRAETDPTVEITHRSGEILDNLGVRLLGDLGERLGVLDLGRAAVPDVVDWLDDPFIAAGQFVSVYGPSEGGKSLFAQERAATMVASGRRVLYLDNENERGMIATRFSRMGCTRADMQRLHYLSFPGIGSLNTQRGSADLVKLVDLFRPDLVVIDTWSKFVEGDENSSSTHNEAYRLTIAPVRSRGIAVLAIDHTGRDVSKGPRGGMSKMDNVDRLWLLTAKRGNRIRLESQKNRPGHPGPEVVELARKDGPLRHEQVRTAAEVTPDVLACVAKLDELAVPVELGREKARTALAASAFVVGTDTLRAAVNLRRERADLVADEDDQVAA